ncbi:MAG: FHA domain-containing protein [Myxococcota bacterium]
MSGNTTKPRSADVKPRDAGVPVVDLVYDNRRVSVVIGRAAVVLGRGESADITVDNDGLSREHAKFVPAQDGVVQLVDLESTNGTFVNGERVTMQRLRERDVLLFGPDVRGAFRYAQPGEDVHGVLGRLTDRQLHVACLVAEGMTSAEIAAELGLSPRTVDSHLARIFRRVEARGRAELARLVTEAGLADVGRR